MKKIATVILVILSTTLFSGCFSYHDINKVLFVTSVLVDIDSEKNPILYVEAAKPYRSTNKGSEKGQKIIYKGTGKTVFQAERDINISTSYRLNFTQNKAILFTRKAAEYGINNFIDFFERDHEFLVKPHIGVYVGDPEALMKIKTKEEDYIGIFLADLFRNQGAASRAVSLTLNEYMIDRTIGDKTSVITEVNLKKDQPEEKIEINGGAVIKNDKMVGMISKEEGECFNFLTNRLKYGTLEEENPDYRNKFVTLDVLNSKTKTNIVENKNNITLIKNINVVTNLCEADKGIVIDKNAINIIEHEAEQRITQNCTEFFNKYKKQGTDIFNLEEQFQQKYPNQKSNDIIQKTKIQINVNVKIKSSADNINF